MINRPISTTPMTAQQIFIELTTRVTSRDRRLTELLRDPQPEYTDKWFMCVPRAFNEALDIRQTDRMIESKKQLLWTQGSTFYFSTGDTLYDTPLAYEAWSEALQHINVCVQVDRAIPSNISDDGVRFGGSMTVTILTPNAERTRMIERGQVSLSQDEFVSFLISGPTGTLLEKIQEP